MKLGYFKFSVITFISLLIIIVPALSQVAPYKATIIDDFWYGRVKSIVKESTHGKLADQVYLTIRPHGNPQPENNILLGKISLSKLQENLQKKVYWKNILNSIKLLVEGEENLLGKKLMHRQFALQIQFMGLHFPKMVMKKQYQPHSK